MFEDVICGLMSDKTRILVTHASEFLHKADRIIIMKNGQISKVISDKNDPALGKLFLNN
jgi:ABC-type transport system involved in cytochrome bd biosynthesis fused ATPase/permease subunit